MAAVRWPDTTALEDAITVLGCSKFAETIEILDEGEIDLEEDELPEELLLLAIMYSMSGSHERRLSLEGTLQSQAYR